jgi:hypothetical protein
LSDIYYQYFLTTSEVGSYRLKNSSFSFYDVFFRYRFIYASLLLLLYLAIKSKNFNKYFKITKFEFVYLLLSINFIMIFHQLLTMNQAFIYSLIFLNSGLCFKFIEYDKKKFFNNKLFFLLIIISVLICFRYHYKYNEPRRFNDLTNANKEQGINAGEYFPSLNNLDWFTNHTNDPKTEIENLKEIYQILKMENKRYSLITDYQFLSVELGRYGNFPIKWYHADVSFPNMRSIDNKVTQLAFSNFFIKQLKNNNIDKIYFVPPIRNRINLINAIIKKNCIIYETKIIKLYGEMSIKCL